MKKQEAKILIYAQLRHSGHSSIELALAAINELFTPEQVIDLDIPELISTVMKGLEKELS